MSCEVVLVDFISGVSRPCAKTTLVSIGKTKFEVCEEHYIEWLKDVAKLAEIARSSIE